ncbi:VOC family protein [Staphylococcus carnosus]|uniref:Lyase n=3 Tax=Staphylococcus carnosus TaxID=1281 RepID=B9DLG5_STACT|nr:VOC family protein [Staphylococcus carnosus]KKB24562.1 glyoxalase/bleomycin resistance protein/dioxygenase [Staphylococcus carnosus]KOR12232.1 bleomycin resistance protein [Staphylococcus carnosus]QPT03218.1 VOC family protein [Staphylococcus carnosus]QQS86184.1 VOC family protein [Staphylococcus carnosus]UQA68221.1 VOC family protein [Staphylococcus carnosus]
MEIKVASIFVDNQDQALKFYTEILGFQKKADEPAGEYRWITVVSPENPDGTELLLEPNNHPVAKAYQEGLKEEGIPCTMFDVEDVQAEYQRLKEQGVGFTMAPMDYGSGVKFAIFDDTCGNLVQIIERKKLEK